MTSLFLAGVVVRGEDVLYSLPYACGHERFVSTFVLDAAIHDHAFVVGVPQDLPVPRVLSPTSQAEQLFGLSTQVADHTAPPLKGGARRSELIGLSSRSKSRVSNDYESRRSRCEVAGLNDLFSAPGLDRR